MTLSKRLFQHIEKRQTVEPHARDRLAPSMKLASSIASRAVSFASTGSRGVGSNGTTVNTSGLKRCTSLPGVARTVTASTFVFTSDLTSSRDGFECSSRSASGFQTNLQSGCGGASNSSLSVNGAVNIPGKVPPSTSNSTSDRGRMFSLIAANHFGGK